MGTDVVRIALLAWWAGVALPALAAPIPLVNPGFDSKEPGEQGNPKGWYSAQHTGSVSYDFALDSGRRKDGSHSMRIVNIGPEPWGTLAQVLPAAAYAGRTVRLSAWIRTEGIPDARGNGVSLLLLAQRGGELGAHVPTKKSRVAGDTDWKRHAVELRLPPATNRLEVGVTLEGQGTAWVDGFALEVVEP